MDDQFYRGIDRYAVYQIVGEDLMKLARMAERLSVGSDKMRDEGNLLNVLVDQMREDIAPCAPSSR